MDDPFGPRPLPEGKFDQCLRLIEILKGQAQNAGLDEREYTNLRKSLLNDPRTKPLLPQFVRSCRDADQLWTHLRSVAYDTGSWQKRRTHIDAEFNPLLDHLESHEEVSSDAAVSGVIKSFNVEGINMAWSSAIERRTKDPEGAITSARSLLESVCKFILEECGETGFESDQLPTLYGRTAKQLNIAPSQHTEDVFKGILGGCTNVVNNLGSLRNKIGDAHGQGKRPIKPAPRHAALAVNLAGSMAMFLLETWEYQQEKTPN